MTKRFEKKLDTWLDEPREIVYEAVVIGENGEPHKEKVKETIYEKVKFTKAPIKKFTCASGEHDYFMMDRVRHIAKCNKCPKHKFLFASSQTIRDGKIVDRISGQVFD